MHGLSVRGATAWIPSSLLRTLGVLCCVCGVTAASAQEPPPDLPVPVDTLVVASDRSAPDPFLDLPTFGTIRTVDDATERVLSVADVLEETAGVRVRRYGGLGALSTASIRGSSPGQVEVYLDGLPLNSAQFGATNLADLALDNLDRVEVYRSAAPAQFATGGIGGVVNLVTRPSGRPRTVVSLSGGSFDTWKSTLLNSGSVAGFRHLISYRQLQTRGDFSYRYDPGTRHHNEDDDEIRLRENNDFREHSVLLKVEAPPIAGIRLSLQDDWFLKESGFAGRGNLVYDAARFDNRRHNLSVAAELPLLLARRLRARVTGFRLYRRDRYFNPEKEPGLNRNDLVHRFETDGVKGQLGFAWYETGQVLNVVAEERHERFQPWEDHPRIGDGFTRERRARNIVVEDNIRSFRDRLTVVLAYRYQEARDNFYGPVPFGRPPEEREDPHQTTWHGPSVGARVAITDGFALKANRTEYSRFPTLTELFGGGVLTGNPELTPELGVTWDGGATWRFGGNGPLRASVEVGGFHSTRDSLIYLVQTGTGSFKARNLERAVAKGVEIGFTARVFRRIGFEGSFTSQDVRQEGVAPQWEGKWLPYVSPREFFLRTTFDLFQAQLRHEYSFFDRYYRDAANQEIDAATPRRLHNVGIRYRLLGDRVTADIDVVNAFDKQTEDVFGFPMPGRSINLTLELDLH